ncbi:uncharacterized protein LOC135223903 [Macrobrachium nipponense]|uniref:uncharacterized protein LOC135223903 n=1 Tax=Macrobrachium nipponense TaxID=159736 RepID=UPI0030C7FE29
MHGGSTGIKAFQVGLLGTAGSNLRGLTGYRRLMFTRRLHVGWRHLRLKDPKRDWTPKTNSPGNPSIKSHGFDKPSAIIWSLLVGRGRHIQALEDLKELAQVLLRLVTRQFEVQTAERIRRGLQLYSVYSRLWGEEAARAWLKSIRRVLITRGRRFLLSAVCFSNYNWDANKISDESLRSAVRDLNSVEELCRATVQCDSCGKRQVIDQQMARIDYCMCDGHLGYTNTSRVYDSWEPFIERAHHIVWRKKHEVHQHLYAYKVYGTYDDVSLSAFMEVQLNSDFRTEWDDTALQLRVLDSQKESNSDLIYWLVKYPHFFANRDYIYKRRFMWNEEKQEAVILNEAVSLNNIPEEKGVHRVSEYWSTMVIRAKEDASKPGLEYTLTYFDNPGTSLPQWLTNFIAVTGFPSFLEKVHEAAVSLQAIHEEGKDVYISLPKELRYAHIPKFKKPSLKEPTEFKVTVDKDMRPVIIDVPQVMATIKDSEDLMPLLEDSKREMIEGIDIVNEESSKGSDDIIEIQGHMPAVAELLEREESKEERGEMEDLNKNIEEKEFIEKLDEKFVPKAEPEVNEEIFKSENKTYNKPENEKDTTFDSRQDNKIISESSRITSDLDINMTGPDADKSLQVQLGSKVVEVDILEGMEVVAPNLDKKTALSKNVEKLATKAFEELENRTVLVERLKSIRRKLKLFKKHAIERKEISLKKMEEFENRSRYESFDDQTQKHLEKLFDAMREVLQADKDMRTGKGLMSSSSVHVDEGKVHSSCESDDGDPCNHNSFVIQAEQPSDHEDVSILSNEKEFSDSPVEKNSNEKDKTSKKESRSSDDPPPPPPSQPSVSEDQADSVTESESSKEITSTEIETYNGIDTVDYDPQNHFSYNARKSWLSFPNPMGWLEQKKKVGIEVMPSIKEEIEVNDSENYVNSIVSQVWYIVGLGWILSTNSEPFADGEDLSEEKAVSKLDSNDKEKNSNWYWYPVSGAYRLYLWAFKSSKETA